MTKREDLVANCFTFNEAYSYKFITKYGTLNLLRVKSSSQKVWNPVDSLGWDLYWTGIAIETAIKNEENQLTDVYFVFNLFNEHLEDILNENNNNKNYFFQFWIDFLIQLQFLITIKIL